MIFNINPRQNRSVIVVDDFLTDPEHIRFCALSLDYYADSNYFRGKRTATAYRTDELRVAFEHILGKKITNWEHPVNGVFQYCVAGEQLVYHSDGNTHAAVLYLTPDAPVHSGTTIYRSKSNKARSVSEAVKAKYGNEVCDPTSVNEVVQEMYGNKLLDRTAWEEVDEIGNRYNRLVIWDASLVHAPTDYFGHDINTGRLFMMFFFDAV